MKANEIMMELNEEQLEESAGGHGVRRLGKDFNKLKPCITQDQKHKYVKTGRHREANVLPLGLLGWTQGQDEYLCTICGYKVFWNDDLAIK